MRIAEWVGVGMAIAYGLMIATNIGWEVPAFITLLISSGLFMIVSSNKKLWGMFTLQIFYAAIAIIGMVSWS